jgi:hypothetical protein
VKVPAASWAPKYFLTVAELQRLFLAGLCGGWDVVPIWQLGKLRCSVVRDLPRLV